MAGPGTFKWGSLAIQARNVTIEDVPREAPRLGEGFAGSQDRLDVRSHEVQSLHLGLGIHISTGEETDSKRYKASEGLWAHQVGKLVLPPALTAQATLQAVNASTYKDANKGVVTARSSLGGTTPLNYYGVGPYLIKEDTSGVLSVAHTFTDNITWIGEVTANSTRYFAAATDNTTNDAVVTTDPTAGSISWSTWFAYTAGDQVDWFWSMREIGNGHTIIAGKVGGVTGLFHLAHTAALATAPSPVVGSATRDIPAGGTVSSVTAVPGVLTQVQVEGTPPTLGRWKRETDANADALPADVAASGDSLWAEATGVSGAAGEFPSYALRALGYDFSSIWDFPNAIIKGISYAPYLQESGAAGNIYDLGVYVYTLDQQSFAPNLGLTFETGTANEWSTTFAQRTYGGSTHQHGRPWSANDLKILQVDHSAEGNPVAGGVTMTPQIDYMGVTVYYQLPGTHLDIATGSELIGPDPVVAGRLWVIEPEGDDPTSRLIPRRLVRIDIDYDSGALRPSATLTPQSNLPCFPYVLAGAIGEEALFIALGNNKDLAKHFLRIPFNTLVPDDIEWSRDQGFTEDWGISALYALGNDCILQCALTGATAMQDMLFEAHSDSVHMFGPRHTIAALPLRMKGQGRVSAASRYRHWFVPQTDLSSGLQAYWPLNEASGNALDVSGNARNLAETGGTIATTTGKTWPTARLFVDADTEQMETADAAWNSITGDMTICGWFKLTLDNVGDQALVSKQDFGTNFTHRLVYSQSNDQFRWSASGNGTTVTTVNGTQLSPATGTWYFLCVRHRNGSNIGININAGTEVTASHTGGLFDSNADFVIGAGNNGGGEYFDGTAQDVAIWNRVLTAAEETAIYNGGLGRAILGIEGIRQYTPDTTHLDPFATLSAVTKQNGPLHITLPELPMMGPPEGRNALLTARLGSRQVSATKTIALYYSIDGGTNWVLWTTFTAYGATATLSPPVAASTVALRIALNNAGTSADTPSGLPITIFGGSDFPPRKRYTVELDETWLFGEQGGAGGTEKLWDTLQTLAATLSLQEVYNDGVSQGVARWNRFRSGTIPGTRSTAANEPLANPAEVRHVLVFDEVAV